MLGCRKVREPVLKIPENADDCLHLFNLFTDPAFDLAQARTGLGLTGEPKVLQSTPSWRRHTFEDQIGIAKSVTLDTSSKDDGSDAYFSAIYIDYRHLPGFSLSTMKRNFGPADVRTKRVPVIGHVSAESFTNMRPGQKEKEVTSFSFYPEPKAPDRMKVDILFTCDATYWDTKTVDFLRLQRRPI
jgi:hypothetical protein